jgi:periplasmic divalent cation tolerance protein
MNSGNLCEVILTAPDADWLATFAKHLVADRLCAAAHMFEPVRSVYWWQGELHERTESRVALHTRRALVSQIVERTKREHPYVVPCVAAQTLVDGNPAYLEWVAHETTVQEKSS